VLADSGGHRSLLAPVACHAEAHFACSTCTAESNICRHPEMVTCRADADVVYGREINTDMLISKPCYSIVHKLL